MSLRSLGTLAQQRRAPAATQQLSGGVIPALSSLEAAIPTEVVALYTGIIAGCQSVLNQDVHSAYLAFRLVIYLIGLASTTSIAFRSVRPAITGTAVRRNRQTLQSPELLTATLSYAAWGVALPGSFLYGWLSSPALSVVVITVTAVTGFLLAAFFAPKLRSHEDTPDAVPPGPPPVTPVPPALTP